MAPNILVSAGEASGDYYASLLIEDLRRRWPGARFFGCAGPRMRRAGVETVIEAESLAVVGLVEVLGHLPRIHGKYRQLLQAAGEARPSFAVLADSPDFHLRVAKRLKGMGVSVIYLVAPQVWAWRKGRIAQMRRNIDRLLCIFPFEEEFFRNNGLAANYIGHPLAGRIRPSLKRAEFFRKHRIPEERQLVTVLPGSRKGEASRHLPAVIDAVNLIYREQATSFVLAASDTTGAAFFRERIGGAPIQVIEGETWDAIAHAGLALAASGTVTVEAALLGTPMVTFYRVNATSWALGKLLVNVPYYSMVNLVAGRAVVPELIQSAMTGEHMAREALALLRDAGRRDRMREDLADVSRRLAGDGDAIAKAGAVIENLVEGHAAHVS